MKKIKLKNKSKKKYSFKFIKTFIYIVFFLLSTIFTVKYYIDKNYKIENNDYLNFLLNSAYYKNTDNYIFKETVRLLSNVDLKKANTLLDNKFKETKKNNNIIKKDEKAGEDDYKEELYNSITSFIEDKEKTKENPIIYLYNSHQLETYSNQGLETDNITPNVLMTSYLLKNELNKNDIPTIVEDTNISEFIKISGLSSDSFYASTRIFIKNSLNKYKSLKYFIDIHRDSVDKNISTVTINDKNYAKILFVLGTTNKNYKENEKNMKKLDELADKLYPGLSRGIYNRPTPNWPDSYNQDLNSGVMLIEVGAKENTIEEVSNTVNALCNIIKEFIKGENK